MRIFDVRSDIEEILARECDPETGEIAESAIEKLNELQLTLEELALQLAAYSIGERTEAEAVEAQAKRLRERAAKHGRRAEWLENVIARNVAVGQKLSDARVTIGWRKSTAVLITDADAVPDALHKYTRTIEKSEIAKLLKTGEKVPGAELEVRQHLVVK